MLKHTVNKVQSLRDFLTADIYRKLKHNAVKLSLRKCHPAFLNYDFFDFMNTMITRMR
jgi:hypothetical protein